LHPAGFVLAAAALIVYNGVAGGIDLAPALRF